MTSRHVLTAKHRPEWGGLRVWFDSSGRRSILGPNNGRQNSSKVLMVYSYIFEYRHKEIEAPTGSQQLHPHPALLLVHFLISAALSYQLFQLRIHEEDPTLFGHQQRAHTSPF